MHMKCDSEMNTDDENLIPRYHTQIDTVVFTYPYRRNTDEGNAYFVFKL